jgi:hypothetical protein
MQLPDGHLELPVAATVPDKDLCGSIIAISVHLSLRHFVEGFELL